MTAVLVAFGILLYLALGMLFAYLAERGSGDTEEAMMIIPFWGLIAILAVVTLPLWGPLVLYDWITK